MPIPPDSVDERIMFSGCPSARFVCSSVHSFFQTDLVTTVSPEWLEQSHLKLQEIFIGHFR